MNDWPSGMLVKPIVDWPGEPTRPGSRTWAPFRASWRQTLQLLERELRQIAATSRVLQVDIPERDFRIDGFPRANARQNGPGVILTFTAPVAGDLSYPCDTYTDWQDNLRAIALALEALRKVDRYGVTKRGEQYAGFKALPPGTIALGTGMTLDEAIVFIADAAGVDHLGMLAERRMGGDDLVRVAYKLAARKLHPDHGGTEERMQKLNEAKRVIDQNRPAA